MSATQINNTGWCVLAGATTSGKTTVQRILQNYGLPAVPETWSYVAGRAGASAYKDYTVDRRRFDQDCLSARVDLERKLFEAGQDGFQILERGAGDDIALFEVDGLDTSLPRSAHSFRYRHVFVLSPLELLNNEGGSGDVEKRFRFDLSVEKAYQELGYEVVRIDSLVSAHKRAEKILDIIKADLQEDTLALELKYRFAQRRWPYVEAAKDFARMVLHPGYDFSGTDLHFVTALEAGNDHNPKNPYGELFDFTVRLARALSRVFFHDPRHYHINLNSARVGSDPDSTHMHIHLYKDRAHKVQVQHQTLTRLKEGKIGQ